MALKPFRVSQVNGYIKRILQSDPILGNVSVIGEISNLKYHSSGHVYFTLKDENSKLNCFYAADYLKNLHYELSDGMEVTATGYLSVYERGGSYSLNVKDITLSGIGNLSIAFEKLKKKLEAEGIFDVKYKKKLPFFPKKIGIITSSTGAAVQDIIKIIKSKNNYVDIIVYPCLVQGPEAAKDISKSIEIVNQRFPELDVLILGRGGGSMEELWPFNEEVVARSIFSSTIPIISAVGHETDFTISDFVADYRAETPTAAAHMSVPNTFELQEICQDYILHIKQSLSQRIQYSTMQIQMHDKQKLSDSLQNRLQYEKMRLQQQKEKLDALNPLSIMERGYGILTDENGNLINMISQINPGNKIFLRLKDGRLHCTVDEKYDMDEEMISYD
ncbi:exodeoxyribonuclease VII large subunit [Sinanaerobacter sp. ZZT-01]|uniref:exodeoxyribonuclease VII large subunit n=1 Tax=Sinanaerobacter sp. ZZT-01 TaxID=3111540 RepID=UPI002D78D229|nr:exodeoxyribonuclease VII large subunit [Sinanaerobacter sp. ZZT-01]WRR93126.1 exodeoxyribonuclease VII large subunit [Sinanaerobacter sp. ZZT-01]